MSSDKNFLFHLSQNPAAVLMFELIESKREAMIRERAQRQLFERDYRSEREKEIERRAFEAEAAGRRCWRLGLEDEATQHWQRADRLWNALDRVQQDQEIRLAAMEKFAHMKRSRRRAA